MAAIEVFWPIAAGRGTRTLRTSAAKLFSRHPGLVPGSTVQHTLPLMIERQPCVYILASGPNGTLYVGVTSDLLRRVVQHREGMFDGFTKRYGIKTLVYWEYAGSMEVAILREKQIKRWRRDWKRNLIERDNPSWNDLAVSFGLESLAVSLA